MTVPAGSERARKGWAGFEPGQMLEIHGYARMPSSRTRGTVIGVGPSVSGKRGARLERER